MDLSKIDLTKASREELLNIIAQLQATVAAMAQTITILQTRVKELEERLATDSHNSHKPPSTDNPRRRTRSLRRPSGKKPGGQPGHPGQTLEQVAEPTEVVLHRPEQCGGCGASLDGVAPAKVERRQVIDIPPLNWQVIEHQVEHVSCPRCGEDTAGEAPAEARQPVQYGPQVRGLMVYLLAQQMLPYERAQQMLNDLFGAAPSLRTFEVAIEECAQGLVKPEAQIKRAILKATVVHFDETGFYVEGKRQWLHVASTPKLTYYTPHPKRGKAATDAAGILSKYKGRAVHDAWSTYFAYDKCRHGLCNVHHLRELTFHEEQGGQPWARKLKDLLLEMKRQVAAAKAAGRAKLGAATRRNLEEQYREIVAEGLALNPSAGPRSPGQRGRIKQSKARNLLERLRDHRELVLAFLYDFRVPFENSQAERDLRMMKVKQKISGCFRSSHGAAAFCRIRGYLSTLQKQGHPMLAALARVFKGDPLIPNPTAR